MLDKAKALVNSLTECKDNLQTILENKNVELEEDKDYTIMELIREIPNITTSPLSTEVEDEFSTRKTANGNTIYDNGMGSVANVLNVKGNSEVSENLLVLEDKEEKTTNGITWSIKNGVVSLKGTTTINYWAINFVVNVGVSSGTYSFNNFLEGTNSASSVWQVYDNGSWINLMKGTYTLTSPTLLRWYIHNLGSSVDLITSPMLVKGSTIPTTFSQGYTGIKSANFDMTSYGRNLLDLTNATWYSRHSYESIAFEDEKLKFSSIDTSSQTSAVCTSIKLPKGTYTFSFESTDIGFRYYNIGDEVETSAGDIFIWTRFTTASITFEIENDKYFSIGLAIDRKYSYAEMIKPMLNYGDTALDYQEYKSPTTISLSNFDTIFPYGLQKAGSVYDEIDFKNKKAYRRVGQITLDGDSALFTTANGKYRYVYKSTTNTKAKTTNIVATSPFVYGSTYDEIEDTIYIDANGFITLYKESLQTIDDWNTYLSKHPITINYELKTPLVYSIEDSNNFIAYNNGTEVIDTEVEPTTKVKYLADIDSIMTIASTNASE